ncbi:uncharacterized protein LOC100121644 isoform X2 [Nasonia vitripennis]|uniref:Uncharacterized protein n=1 Tax=Nasonia vitripennis TaxID=7425 RepID=A0A7M7QK12_NASVI|nr:uncharacterized protein LOC100121644 isoform X2 [Nasonia vitripennis]
MNSTNLKHWLSRGELDKLEHVVLEGRGARLLAEQSPDLRTRVFLKGLPNYLTKICQIHDAVVRGSLPEAQRLVDGEPKKKLLVAKDATGTPLIHKSVYYDHQDILEWIVGNYPGAVEQRDREGRTALHYCAACRDPEAVWDILIEAGCDASVCDKRANPAAYYLQRGSEIELPEPDRMPSRRLRSKDPSKWSGSLDFKPSNIRIWIHNRDIGKLQHVLWEGHGSKLRCETSNNVRVKRFLEAAPFIMGTIKDIHSASVKNDLDGFRKKLEEPVSPIILCSKDSNGLNVLHKAAGLGYVELARDILDRYPAIVNAQDNENRAPLHYAAVCRDGGAMYDLLVEYGADESKIDNRQKTAAFYKNRPADLDLTSLVMVPDAPRVSGTSYPRHWDWRIIETDQPLTRMRRTGNNADDDSAFGSAESAKLSNADVASPEIENAEGELNGNEAAEEEEAPAGDEPAEPAEKDGEEESAEHEDEPKPDGNDNPEIKVTEAADDDNNNDDEAEEGQAEEEQQQPVEGEEAVPEAGAVEEEPAPSDEAVPTEEEEAPEKEPEEEGDGDEEEEEDKAEPSTADSGLVGTPNDDEEQINGEEEEEEEEEEAEPEARGEEAPVEGHEPGMAVDEETAELVENGSMEQLAALVLTGEGHRLVGRHSSNPELQAFIDNVPAYMAKIRAVHKAAREGNLKELQISLDRRKFAVAKDPSSPHGATPLHVAVIFGHTPVVRYLAGRFPETAHALDLDGRTPLHYAATLADNGHYYNLLLHLGANPLVQDNFGQKADYYKQNQDDLSHKQLLRDFGAPDSLADEMLVDKDLNIFQDEEGRYLASSLGDPLIRGLTEVATTRPKDPVTYLATYLYNFANQDKPEEKSEDSNILIIPEGEETEQEGNSEETQENETENEIENDNDNDDGYPQSPDLDTPESLFASTERDENGQSSLHFAANRSHAKDGLYHLLQERQINIAFRDSRYRTGRDVAELSGNPENVQEIDRFVVYLAARGETDKLVELLMEGYDHILDTEDDGKNVLQIAEEEDNKSTVEFLKSIKNYTELRDEIHRAIRAGESLKVRELLEVNGEGARLLALGKNSTGRCSLHIAVLREHEDVVRYIAKTHPETLRVGDNLERTALHYAMGVPSVENMSSILIKAGAKRVQKDLRSRQPSYYFMNKTDIKQLQDEEESMNR